MDFFNFYTGRCFNAYTYLGVHPIGTGSVFRTFAPMARNVSLIGEFSGWDPIPMEKVHDGNFWEVIVPEAEVGMMYKYKITGADGSIIDHADPYGTGMELRPANASIIRNLEEYTFGDDAWMAARRAGLAEPVNIYELHLGSWRTNTEDENGWYAYDEIAEPLVDYLKASGYNYVEFMPLSEHPCDESWGYQNTGFYSPTSRYGTAAQLMALVDILHQNDIGVILDFVPIHFAVDDYGLAHYDGTALYEYPYEAVGVSEWGSCNFMHSRGEVQSFLQSAADYWLRYYHFDGLRMDAISRILYWQGDEARGVNANGVEFLKTMNSGLKTLFPNCMLIAEDSTNYGQVTTPVNQGGLGFDYKWDMGWMNDTLDYFKKTPKERIDHYHKLTFSMAYFYNEHYLLPLSHDEVVHGKATIINKMYGDYVMKFPQARALYLYMMAHPGKKLNFMGNEIGQFREWDEKREQDWDLRKYPLHDGFYHFMADLNRLYLEHPALSAQDYHHQGFEWLDCEQDGTCTYAFIRRGGGEALLAIFNFGAEAQVDYTLEGLTGGRPKILFRTEEALYGGELPKGQKGLHYKQAKDGTFTLNLDLSAFSGILLALPEKKKERE